jgi:hypothetical protein
MSRDPILVRWLVACYPAGWRARYGDEYAAVLSDTLTSAPVARRPALLANILYGAVDARLNPEGPLMSERVRVPIATAVWAAGLFGVAGFGFQKITEYPDLRAEADQHAAVGWSFNVLRVTAIVALLGLLLAVLPVVVGLVRQRPARSLRILAVPPLTAAAWVAVLPLALWLARGHSVHSMANIAAVAAVVVTGLGVVAATAWTARTILPRTQVLALPRLRTIALPAVAAAMAATTLACAAWGIALRSADPSEFGSDDGLLATGLSISWAAVTVVMAGATVLAFLASRRERPTAIDRPAA